MHKKIAILFSVLAALAQVESAPLFARHEGHDSPPDSDFVKQNGLDAQKLNSQFASMKTTDSCESGQNACVDSGFAQCVGGKWVVTPCSGDLKCFALPLVNQPGTSLVCDTEDDATARIAAAGATGGITDSGDGAPVPATTSVAGSGTGYGASIPAITSSSPSPASSSTPTPTPQNDDSKEDCGDEANDNQVDDDCDDDETPDTSNADNVGNERDCEDGGSSAPVPTATPAPSTAASTTGNQPASSSISSTLSAVQQPALTSAPAEGGYKYRRQAFTLVPTASSQGAETTDISAPQSVSTASSVPIDPSSSPAATFTPSTLVSSFTAIPTASTASPTVATADAVTVTITSISTVFAQATDCTSPAATPTVTGSFSSVVAAPTIASSAPPIITLSLPNLPATSGSTSPSLVVSNPASSTAVVASGTPKPLSSSASEGLEATSSQGPALTFFPSSSKPTLTPAPTPATTTFDLSDLLTATIPA